MIPLPSRSAEFLSGVLPRTIGAVDLVVGMPAMRDCLCALQQAASSQPGLITIHPAFWEPETAAGIALLAHELYHQAQMQKEPQLLDLYAAEEARIWSEAEATGIRPEPYDNLYEAPAYDYEARVYQLALDEGFPPGAHTPLLLDETGQTRKVGPLQLAGLIAATVGAIIIVKAA